MTSENDLIERIARAVPSIVGGAPAKSGGRVRLGIGDDAALIAGGGTTDWVVSCDAFLEGIHFLSKLHPPDSVGYKSLARATSDLAAMGATPKIFFLTLALPKQRTGSWLDGYLAGMGRAARQLGMRIAGGDTTRFPSVSIGITVFGDIERGLAVTRSGARPGDLIYVSGRLGRAQLGLKLVEKGLGKERRYRSLLQPHLYPSIRVKLGALLAKRRIASAMMDISDGLSTDLQRLCTASGVGARIFAGSIPCVEIPSAVEKILHTHSLDPLQLALHGGDDYELIFTVPPGKAKRLRRAPGFDESVPIGEITSKKEMVLVFPDNHSHRLQSLGWDPFRRR